MSDIDDITKSLSATNVSESGLSFAGKSLKLDSEEDAKKVTEEIDKCKVLQYLNLEGNTLGVEAAKAVGSSLEKHPEFKRALWKDMFTGRMKTEIPKALEYLGDGLVKAGSKLTELDMSDNAFGPIGVQGLASLIKSPSFYALEVLKLNNNGLGITGGKLLASALIDCYNHSKTNGRPLALRVFIAGRNRLENDGAKALAEVFKMMGTLEQVEMPQNGIYHVGISALAEAFTHNKNLETLNLNDNTIGPTGAKAIAGVLHNLQKLKYINFGDCLLKSKGAELLANALKDKHENLEELVIGYNEIRKNGGLAIAKALGNKLKMKYLVLDGNQFGEEGCKEILNELKKAGKEYLLDSIEEDEGDDDEESEEEEEGDGNETINSEDEKNCKDEAVLIEEFLKIPSEENFTKLGDERKNLIMRECKKSGQIILNDYIEIIMKVSSLYGSKKEMIKNFALDITEKLYKELFEWAASSENSAYVYNVIFVNLGMIKSEDKSFKPSWDLKSCQNALKTLGEDRCVPEIVQNILQVFFARTQKNGYGEHF